MNEQPQLPGADIAIRPSPDPTSQIRKPAPSARQLAANRKNALRSTGPKTPEGKARSRQNGLLSRGPKTLAAKAASSQNALKHGLCRAVRHPRFTPILPDDSAPDFLVFKRELETALQPRTTLQRTYFTDIVNLAWRLYRLADSQIKIFDYEMEHAPPDPTMSAADLIARRFADDPQNGFLLLNRYEQSIRNNLHRLIKLLKAAGGPDLCHPDEI
jgi:hypothetical protein